MPKEMTEQQRINLAKGMQKAGEPGHNPTGRNGWTAMRERYRGKLEDQLDTLTDVLFHAARDGDVQALRLALGAVVDVKQVELTGEDGAPLDFITLAEKARGESSG
jgi:hypothetical protein